MKMGCAFWNHKKYLQKQYYVDINEKNSHKYMSIMLVNSPLLKILPQRNTISIHANSGIVQSCQCVVESRSVEWSEVRWREGALYRPQGDPDLGGTHMCAPLGVCNCTPLDGEDLCASKGCTYTHLQKVRMCASFLYTFKKAKILK